MLIGMAPAVESGPQEHLAENHGWTGDQASPQQSLCCAGGGTDVMRSQLAPACLVTKPRYWCS